MWIAFLPMACIAAGVLLPEPRRSRLRHELQLGHPRHGSAHRLARRLEQHDGRPHHHAEPGVHRREVHVPAVRLGQPGEQHWCDAGPRASSFIMGMTWICVVGIELSARTQMVLLGTELARARAVQRGRADQGATAHTHGFVYPSLSWLTPTDFGGVSNLSERAADRGVHLLGLGHRGERERGVRGREHARPGSRACSRRSSSSRSSWSSRSRRSAVRGADFLTEQPRRRAPRDRQDRVRHVRRSGRCRFKLLIIAILTSSAASCQTTILPAARTALSMAIHRAFPPKFGEVDSRHLTPAFSTWFFGIGVEHLVRAARHRSAATRTATCSRGRPTASA